ncbi:ComEC/Rec2 family competence protein [Geodermatophilus sp. DSM 44513]|uniref:ComEC/Rec2 family competence protein n=1 Tax=Geodermatophilus sp. DSM 44513 TaxID=1528104 RepID=UPI0014130F0D|nr:MBL fold metallo-hydrolase [Geodermatophilus sp. DSM 44513]WNV76709.1 MBL fold metallo-hydrolase [Geodermatophilus sp. DSM 44513]
MTTEVTVLDVGHGNAAVAQDGDEVVVVDAGRGPTLLDQLETQGILTVNHLVLSHADADHIGSAIALLSSHIVVKKLWYNADAQKQSQLFEDLSTLASDKSDRGELNVSMSLNSAAKGEISTENLSFEIMHPSVSWASTGPRDASHRGGELTSNSMSAVVRISGGSRSVLLCGDMDSRALLHLQQRNIDLTADVLVFPHHGGHCDGDDQTFARELAGAVQPASVVFSLGRDGYSNPQPDIVLGVLEGSPASHIACTQLSKRCHPTAVARDGHLASVPAAGRGLGKCCAGSLPFAPLTDSLSSPDLVSHLDFVKANVDTPLCLNLRRARDMLDSDDPIASV